MSSEKALQNRNVRITQYNTFSKSPLITDASKTIMLACLQSSERKVVS